MQNVTTTLMWKEWRAYRVPIGLAALLFVAAWAGLAWLVHDREGAFDIAAGILYAGTFVVAMFAAATAAAHEQSAGTVAFLKVQPVSMKLAAVVKLAFVVAAIVVPIAALMAAVSLWAAWAPGEAGPKLVRVWGIDNWFVAHGVSAAVMGVSIAACVLAFGVNRSDEIRAAAGGFLTLILAWSAVIWLGNVSNVACERPSNEVILFMAALPGGMAALADELPTLDGRLRWAAMAMAALAHGGMLAWFVTRFARVTPTRLQTVERDAAVAAAQSAKTAWLAPPRRNQWTALVWKQMRESAPLGLLGGALVLGLFVVVWAVADADTDADAGLSDGAKSHLLQLTVGLWGIAGLGISLVAGLGVALDDLRPELLDFWRSRPVPLAKWFSAKVLAGLLVTLLSLAAGLMAALLAASCLLGENAFAAIPAEGWLWAGVWALLQAAIFLLAFSAMAILRQPVYAAFVAAGIPIGLTVVANWVHAWQSGFVDRGGNAAYEITYGALLAVVVLAPLVVAWYALKHNWSWKR